MATMMEVSYGKQCIPSNLHRRLECGELYTCGGCRMPVGDSNDVVGNHVGDDVALLKVVSEFVKSGKLTKSSDPSDADSEYLPLSCSNCHNVLGKFYSFTPAYLNYKLGLYYIDNTAVKGYKFGENLQQIIPPSEAPITLEICYYYEEEFKKQKVLLEMLLDRFSKLQDAFFQPSQQDS